MSSASAAHKARYGNHVRTSLGEKLGSSVIHAVLFVLGFATLYPFLYVLSNAVSSPDDVFLMKVVLWPTSFSLQGMSMVLSNPSVWQAYYNTLWVTAVGTALTVAVTVTFAYPLSRREFTIRKYFMAYAAIPMFFSGGMIPMLLLIIKLGIYNTRWALVLPGAISLFGTVMARVFFQTAIPDSLVESAKIDGANDLWVLLRVVLPLSTPIVAVLALFNGVSYWNMYVPALLYLPGAPDLQPLQVYLQKILIANIPDVNSPDVNAFRRSLYAIQLKYAVIVVATLPILCVYPFLQKYFVKGVLVGALKE